MKKVFTLGFIAILASALTSCEKCSTCTTLSEDPETKGEELVEQVCGRGKNYNDQVTVYTRANWECTEN